MWNFTVTLNADEGRDAEMHSGAKSRIRIDFPAEFGGDSAAWCPEGLLAASVAACLMTTFRYHLKRKKGTCRTYMSAATATLGKTAAGLRITEVEVSTVIGVEGAQNCRAVRQAAALAENHCAISHSLDCPVRVTWEINEIADSQ